MSKKCAHCGALLKQQDTFCSYTCYAACVQDLFSDDELDEAEDLFTTPHHGGDADAGL